MSGGDEGRGELTTWTGHASEQSQTSVLVGLGVSSDRREKREGEDRRELHGRECGLGGMFKKSGRRGG